MKNKFEILIGFVCYKILLTDYLDFLFKSHSESFLFKIYLWFVGWAGHYAYHPIHDLNQEGTNDPG